VTALTPLMAVHVNSPHHPQSSVISTVIHINTPSTSLIHPYATRLASTSALTPPVLVHPTPHSPPRQHLIVIMKNITHLHHLHFIHPCHHLLHQHPNQLTPSLPQYNLHQTPTHTIFPLIIHSLFVTPYYLPLVLKTHLTPSFLGQTVWPSSVIPTPMILLTFVPTGGAT